MRLAQRGGPCSNCPERIRAGQWISSFGEGWAHVQCVTKPKPKVTISDSCFCKRCNGDLVDLNADESVCIVCGWPA